MAINTAENPSPLDPLDRMPADEPRFLLRGSDPATPPAITEWARVTRMLAIREFGLEPKTQRGREMLKAKLEKCRAAEETALEIDEWRKGQAAEPGKRAQYTEQVQTAVQLAELEAKKVIEGLLRHIQEGRYHLDEARAGLLAGGYIAAETSSEIEGWLARAQEIADQHDPRRDFHEPRLPIKEGEEA